VVNKKNNFIMKRKCNREPIYYYIEKMNDGGRSRNDWFTRALISLEPIYGTVYIANYEGSKKMMSLNKGSNIGVLNLRLGVDIDDDRVDNSIDIEDSKDVEQEEFDKFVRTVGTRIQELVDNNDWVIVNCKAGINRASAAVLAWMVFEQKLSFNNSLKILREKKADAAKYFQFKNRYQSFEKEATIGCFSWPTLSGAGSEKLKKAILSPDNIPKNP